LECLIPNSKAVRGRLIWTHCYHFAREVEPDNLSPGSALVNKVRGAVDFTSPGVGEVLRCASAPHAFKKVQDPFGSAKQYP